MDVDFKSLDWCNTIRNYVYVVYNITKGRFNSSSNFSSNT